VRLSLEAVLLFVMAAILPFEPRHALFDLGAVRFTALEVALGLFGGGLALFRRRALLSLARRPPAPLLFLSALAAAHLLSSALAPEDAALSARFALRMAAMAAMAWLVAACPGPARSAALAGLLSGASLVAGLAVVEGRGAEWLDPLLGVFREVPFNVAGARRATGAAEYPNLAAGFLVYGLVVAAGRFARPGRVVMLLGLSGLLAWGLLHTYSRGALVAAGAGLVTLVAGLALRERGQAARALLAPLTLAACAVAFAFSGEVFRVRLGSEGTAPFYGASYAPEDAAFDLRPREARAARLRVTNTGRRTWRDADAVHLSYHWYEVERKTLQDGGRTRLGADVPPGATVALTAEVRAPALPGRYLLLWDMVHEHTTWFSGQGVPPAAVPVRVAADASAPAAAPPPAPDLGVGWQPGRADLWGLAWRMFRSRPLTGAGSDAFRRRYGLLAGRAAWDRRVYANSLYLETAATTGLAGLGALLLCLGSAARAAVRGLRGAQASSVPPPALVLALLAAVATHGIVDYLLAFTGHYAAFGLLVGLAAAPAGGPSRAA
jgi:hypothetical protein